MLLRISLRAVVWLACVSAVASSHAQQEERVPSGDLSDFFNPPGVKSESIGSTTRTFGSDKKSNPTKSTKSTTKTIDTKSKSSDKSKKSTDASKSGSGTKPTPDSTGNAVVDGSVRVKIETKEELGPIEGGITFGRPAKINWRVGVGIRATATAAKNITCRIPVPVAWPEQTVSVFEEDLPPEITDVSWEDNGNLRFLKLRIAEVPVGEKMIGKVTFAVSTSQIIAPKNTSIFRIPKDRTRNIRPYYGESPEIGMRNTKLKKQAKSLFDNPHSDWSKVEGLYDWVRDNIEERAGEPTGSIDTFLKKSGTGEDRVSLFVAMCRINKVPARMVFVDGSQYAEFYMVDDKEQGHWFPCAVTGLREFGSIGEPKVILQKGDNYRVPGEKKKLKFVPAKASWKGAQKFKIGFSREPMAVRQ